MSTSTFLIATSITEALGAMAAGARPVAGGTDLVVGARQGKSPLPDSLVAIDRLADLAATETTSDGIRIGSLVSHAELMSNPTVVDHYTAIADGAALVGSPATRNVGTIGGNVMNGSPAMDTGAPLAVLGAMVELQSSASGTRTVPVLELWTGPGSTAADPAELCTAILLPTRSERSGSAYVRLEYRRAMEIAVVGAAAAVTLNSDNTIASVSIALTAVAPTIMAVEGLGSLIGRSVDEPLLAEVAEAASAAAMPISDLRAGDRYRRHTVGIMAKRALAAASQRAQGTTIAVPVNRTLGIGSGIGVDSAASSDGGSQ